MHKVLLLCILRLFMSSENLIQVSSETGTLRRLIIHSPDAGIGKVVPNKFKELLYDDTVYLNQMRREYNDYVKLLLYFLDEEKAAYINNFEKHHFSETQADCYKPDKPEYFNSDKVLDTQYLLAQVLEQNNLRQCIIAAVCATEGCSFEIEKKLESIENSHELSKILISGVLKRKENYNEFIFQPLPNFIFTRDIAVVINDHLLLGKAANDAREREMLLMKYIALHHLFKEQQHKVIEVNESSDFFLLSESEQQKRKTSLEGGDIMMIAPAHLLVGCSERTTVNAVNKIVHSVFGNNKTGIEKISVIKIPGDRSVMHIDTVFTQVRKDVWVLFGKFSEQLIHIKNKKKYSYYHDLNAGERSGAFAEAEIIRFVKALHEEYNPARNYKQPVSFKGIVALLKNISNEDFHVPENEVKIIYCGNNVFPFDEREQWTDACNLLALKEGVVVSYDRNEETLNAFRENGFAVVKAQELFQKFTEKIITPKDVNNTVITLSSAELSRARGGSHCMSMPLLREKI